MAVGDGGDGTAWRDLRCRSHSTQLAAARCSGVIHHGGFGTTAEGIRAGIPALVIPHVIDQFYWGQRIYDLGVGPTPIRRINLDAANLVGAIARLVQDAELKNNATRLGEKVRLEEGLENAVRIIKDTFD